MTTISTEQVAPADGHPSRVVPDIADVLRSSVAESVALRRTPDPLLDVLETHGLTRLAWPSDRGGRQASMRERYEVLEALAQHDGSAAWVIAIYTALPNMITLFGDAVFEEWLGSENPRAAGVFSLTGTATAVDGGYRVSGKWPFVSGQHHAGWTLVPALQDQGPPLALLVPRSEFAVVDEWDLTGLIGTGSNTLGLDDAFVPARWAIPFQNILDGVCDVPDSTGDDPYYRQPLVPIISCLSAGPALGLARAAARYFSDRIQQRGITYSVYEQQAEAPITHAQLARIQSTLDHAEFVGRRIADIIDHHVDTGRPWDMPTRVRCRYDGALTVKLARDVCDIVQKASGASALRTTGRLTEITRDIHALSNHAFLLYDSNAEMYGQVLAGQSPAFPVY